MIPLGRTRSEPPSGRSGHGGRGRAAHHHAGCRRPPPARVGQAGRGRAVRQPGVLDRMVYRSVEPFAALAAAAAVTTRVRLVTMVVIGPLRNTVPGQAGRLPRPAVGRPAHLGLAIGARPTTTRRSGSTRPAAAGAWASSWPSCARSGRRPRSARAGPAGRPAAAGRGCPGRRSPAWPAAPTAMSTAAARRGRSPGPPPGRGRPGGTWSGRAGPSCGARATSPSATTTPAAPTCATTTPSPAPSPRRSPPATSPAAVPSRTSSAATRTPAATTWSCCPPSPTRPSSTAWPTCSP